MGLTAGRLHVRGDAIEAARVVELLEAGPEVLGWPVADGVLPVAGLVVAWSVPGWVTVADSPWDQFLFDEMTRARLAELVGGVVVDTTLFDGDVAEVGLRDDGRLVGRWRLPVDPAEVDDMLAGWRAVLDAGVSRGRFVDAVTGGRDAGEAQMVSFLGLLGIPAELVVGELVGGGERSVTLERWARTGSRESPTAAGPSELQLLDGTAAAFVGSAFEFPVLMINRGGPGEGLRFTVSGSAIDAGLVSVDAVGSGDGQRVTPCRNGAAELAVTVPAGEGPAQIGCRVRGRAEASGRGVLELSAMTGASSASATLAVHVLDRDDVPLGATPAHAAHCAELVEPVELVACFVCDPVVAGPELFGVFDRVHRVPGLLAPDCPIQVVSLGASRGIGVKSLRAKELTSAPRWRALEARVDELPDLEVNAGLVTRTAMTRNRSPEPDARDGTVVVSFSFTLSRISEEARVAVEDELDQLAEQLLERGVLLQGFRDCWGRPFVFSYRLAVDWPGIHEARAWHDSRSWATRYLWAVASRTWLGAELASLVASDLEPIADLVDRFGAGLSLRASSGGDRRRIEQALANVVPGLAPLEARFLRNPTGFPDP